MACQNRMFAQAFRNCGGNVRGLDRDLRKYLEEYMEPGSAQDGREPELSQGMGYVLACAWEVSQNSEKSIVELPHVLYAMYALPESYAVYYICSQGVEQTDLLQEMTVAYEEIAYEDKTGKAGRKSARDSYNREGDSPEERDWEDFEDSGQEEASWEDWEDEEEGGDAREKFWQEYATCLNDHLDQAGPLIGRAEELERTMQILCRREKNNPLHIGEPGVGKTAIT